MSRYVGHDSGVDVLVCVDFSVIGPLSCRGRTGRKVDVPSWTEVTVGSMKGM